MDPVILTSTTQGSDETHQEGRPWPALETVPSPLPQQRLLYETDTHGDKGTHWSPPDQLLGTINHRQGT